MFGQVLDKLDSYFGRAFLLSRYTPWLICVAVNSVLVAVEVAGLRATLWSLLTELTSLLVVMLSVWVLAYATSPVIQFATRFLEGSDLPDGLRRTLALSHAWRRDALDRRASSRQARQAQIRILKEVVEELRTARAEGVERRTIADSDLVRSAEEAVLQLGWSRQLIDPIEPQDFIKAGAVLRRALLRNCAEAVLLDDGEDRQWAKRLDSIHELMYDKLAPYAEALAESEDQSAAVERSNRFASHLLAPTGLGNEAAALRDYCSTRYGIDFDFFWPRFLMVVRNDPKVSESLSTAKIQLDFSVLMLVLSSATVIGWFLYLILNGTTILAALMIFGVGPVAMYAWLGIVHAAYFDFAEVVRSAIDLRRFDVLVGLRQTLPASSGDEPRCWEAVQRLVLLNEHRTNASLRHPSS